MLPNHNRPDLDLIERLRKDAEADTRHRWHSDAIRQMAVFGDICPHCERSLRREKLALSTMFVGLMVSLAAVVAIVWLI